MEDRRVVALIVVMAIIIVGLGGYIAYEKFFPKKEETKSIINNISVDVNNFYQIGETLERLDSAMNDANSVYYGYLYKQRKLAVSEMDPDLALFLTIQKDMVDSNTERFLIGADVKREFDKLFGKNAVYTPQSLTLGEGYILNYEPTTENFSYIAPIKNNIYPPSYVTTNIKTTLTEENVVVTRKVFYVEYGGNTPGGIDMKTASIYASPAKEKLLGEVQLKNGVINIKEIMGKFSSKFSTYNYTFKVNDDETYSLLSIELVK